MKNEALRATLKEMGVTPKRIDAVVNRDLKTICHVLRTLSGRSFDVQSRACKVVKMMEARKNWLHPLYTSVMTTLMNRVKSFAR